jgi:hypothetical protein
VGGVKPDALQTMAVVAAAQLVLEDDSLIKEGDHVVFDEHGDKKSLVLVKRNG